MTRVMKKIETKHEDAIHHLAYDFYGKRLATCSSDQNIKIWDLDSKNQWICTAKWKAHTASITKVQWCHPEFGQVIASCSIDKTVRIWEESKDTEQVRWIKKAVLSESTRSPIQDIKFAPKHLGLKLATSSKDGFVRIYECADLPNLSHWNVSEHFSCPKSVNSIDWNPNPFDNPMIVVGGDDPVIMIWECPLQSKQWKLTCKLFGHTDSVTTVSWAPHLGRSFHTIATGGNDKSVRIWEVTTNTPEVTWKEVANDDKHNSVVWSVEWNITGTILASSGDDGKVRFWKLNFLNQWSVLSEHSTSGEKSSSVQPQEKTFPVFQTHSPTKILHPTEIDDEYETDEEDKMYLASK